VFERRKAKRCVIANGALWAVGNGLVGSTLVVYLAFELGAPRIGLWLSLIKASPHLVGLLRLSAPAMIGRVARRKTFCIACYLASVLTLLAMPFTVVHGRCLSPAQATAAMVALWCAYHLLEYLANVALWAWIGDLVPQRIRGRFLGRRERWMLAGQIAAMLAAAAFLYGWTQWCAGPRWIGYVILAVCGGLGMLVAIVPLARMPDVETARDGRSNAPQRIPLGDLAAPLVDPRFLRWLAFGCWFSLFNGVTQAAQEYYSAKVLGFEYGQILVLIVGMRLGQLAASPRLGRMADRFGNRFAMLVCLPIVAAGMLFYGLATPERPWWIVAAWTAWIAYAGINICQPNLTLKLAPASLRAAYIAAFQAITGACVAASMIAGGLLLDELDGWQFRVCVGGFTLDRCQVLFFAGWAFRTLGVAVLWFVVEPPQRERASAPSPVRPDSDGRRTD
jgi:MFS family permease